MLTRTEAVYQKIPSPQKEPYPVVTGQYLAKNHLTARDRARLAAAIVDERVKIKDLTACQAARLCRVPLYYVNEARRPAAPPRESLAQMFARSTSKERREMARSAGVDLIWDELIQPLI